MKLHVLQHIDFEDLGAIQNWVSRKQHSVTYTRFYLNESLPAVDEFDALVVMGGPMGTYDEAEYPWLIREKKFIKQALANKTPILGICLGAQLLAEALGAKVYPGNQKEIGWYPVVTLPTAKDSKLFSGMPNGFTPLHWHGDTFDLPEGARLIASSKAYQNQAFDYGDNVLGLQFHLELTKNQMKGFLEDVGDKLKPHEFVQTAEEILGNEVGFKDCKALLEIILSNWAKMF
jgi:GMP synthase (glutamine-hydrolysing)